MGYIGYWTGRTGLPARRLLKWLGLGTSKFHDWKGRYGKANFQGGKVPRDWWLEDWEKRAKCLKRECIRPACPASLEQARRAVERLPPA